MVQSHRLTILRKKKPKEEEKPTETSKKRTKKSIKKESYRASTIASKQDSMIETIRKTVKSLGTKVSFTRITPEEKGKLEDIVYTYKRHGVKTSENEIN